MELKVYQKFNDEVLADELATQLTKQGISIKIEDNQQYFDPSFSGNPLNREIRVMLVPGDFERADKIMSAYYKEMLESIEPDYYLFKFSNKELLDIVHHREDWGPLDYELALKLLNDRGVNIGDETESSKQRKQSKALAAPEPAAKSLWLVGYICALFGGLLGVLVGMHIAYTKKTLADGTSVWRYTDKDRNRGSVLLMFSVASLILWFLIRVVR